MKRKMTSLEEEVAQMCKNAPVKVMDPDKMIAERKQLEKEKLRKKQSR